MHPNDGRVVRNFIVQALRGAPITLYGDGIQTRAFYYVDDLIDGFVKLMAAPDAITGQIKLGNPVETSIAELADLVKELTGSRSRIDDPVQRCPDITEAERMLGWRPETRLSDGLTRAIAYFDRLLSGGQELGKAVPL